MHIQRRSFKMFSKIIFLCLLAAVAAESEFNAEGKPNLVADVPIQATNNTLVPSVTYIADAVECLEEAISIYADDENQASLYAALFEEKHPGNWDVVVGYSAVYIHSSVYVETKVLGKEHDKLLDSKEDDDGKLVLIFSTD